MGTRSLVVALVGSRVHQIRWYSSSAPPNDWFSSIKHSFLNALQQPAGAGANQHTLNLNRYNQLRLQSIQFPYLKRSLLDHRAISKLIQELNQSQPTQSIVLFDDLASVWGFRPTDQDTLAYLSALVATAKPLPPDVPDHLRLLLLTRAQSYQQALKIVRPAQHRSEVELAWLIRLAAKEKLKELTINQLVAELPIANYQNPSLIHGALILTNNPGSLQFILDHLNSGLPLEPWIESDLVQKISQEVVHHGFESLMDVVAKILRRYPHHQHLDRSLQLVETIMSHIQTPSCPTTQVNAWADQIHQTTGIDIFQHEPERLAGLLFGRIASMTQQPLQFQDILDWYQLSRSRGSGVLIAPLISILEFKPELSNRPDLVDQFMADLQSLAPLQPISSSHWLNCLVGFLRLSIYTHRPDLAEIALESSEPGKNQSASNNTPNPSALSAEVSVELIEGLVQVSERRDQAFRFYEELVAVGQPNLRFFQTFLREYFKLLETPRVTTERAQALSIQGLMKILEDMKKYGIRANNQIYSNLLNHFSSIVKKNPRNSSTRIQLERIHTLIKLDSHLEPDLHLLHQLFKAFSYNGLYEKAWSIWDKFFSSPVYAATTTATITTATTSTTSTPATTRISKSVRRRKRSDYQRISHASFATMFDLAGFESERFGDGRLNFKAIEAWDFLLEEATIEYRSRADGQPTTQESSNSLGGGGGGGGPLNKNLFDSWIECLCRARRIEEAVELVFPDQTYASAITVDNHSHTYEVTSEDDTQQDAKYLSYAHKLTPTPSISIHDDPDQAQEDKDDPARGIFKGFVDQRTLSILLRFSNREDHRYLATIDFDRPSSSSSQNHDGRRHLSASRSGGAGVSWSSQIQQLVSAHFPHLARSVKT